MTTSPKISVITTCFNAEHTIERTIKSVISQCYNNFEYIVVDAGSTDRTLDIIKSYSKSIHSISSTKDRGISDGFNRGIQISSGEWIILINADDYLPQNTFSNLVETSQKYPHAEIIYGNMVQFSEDGKETLMIPRGHTHLPEGMVLMHPSTFVRKKVYNDVGLFSLSYKCAMDYDFLLRAYLNKNNFIYINKTLSHFSSGGISNHSLKNKVLGLYECYKSQISHGLKKNPSLMFLTKKILATVFRHILRK